ncbi:MAG: monovalent cation/H(+) antiporter subunit G [Pseudomonadota bacterium]
MLGAGLLEWVVDIASVALLAAGGVFYLIGAIGLNRMPDVFTRMHAASVSETLGLGLLFLGMMLQAGFTLVFFKLVVILALLWLTAPLATHALSRAALHDGEKPLLTTERGLEPVDPCDVFPGLEHRLATPLVSEQIAIGTTATEAAAEPEQEEAKPSNS